MCDKNLNDPLPVATIPAPESGGDANPSAILKFWEMEPFLQYPVVGLCLTFREQKQLLKETPPPSRRLGEFEIHEMLVSSGKSENPLSRKVNGLLMHKFGKETALLRLLPEREFMYHLRASFEAAQFVSVFWAAASRADLSAEARREIFRIIHISMYTNVEKGIQLIQQREQLLKRIEAQTLVISALKRSQREYRLENERLREEQTRTKADLLYALKAKNTSGGAGLCDPSCPAFDRCPRRVLIVGGIERMEARYRETVEAAGGVMEYHDGHMRGGTKQLEKSLRRADIVLCPVNCNSHAACLMVKNYGKKHNKPVLMMPSFSLAAVSHALRNDRPKMN